jgi:bifunctional non-homologous end joining protein LigD
MRRLGVKTRMPGFIGPQLATLKTKPPKGDYLHEIKFDGYRAQVHLLRGKPTIYTRSGHDWTRRFGPIVDALDYDVSAILDGEIVVVEDNRTNFSLLQADLADGRRDRLSLYLFDILFLDGETSEKNRLSNARQSWKTYARDSDRRSFTASTLM